MKKSAVVLAILLACVTSYSQRPSDPALLVPQEAPLLDYVPVENPLAIPAGMTIGSTANVTFDSNGHLWVLRCQWKVHSCIWPGFVHAHPRHPR
jgi:hypothetical protein